MYMYNAFMYYIYTKYNMAWRLPQRFLLMLYIEVLRMMEAQSNA